jgi:hypothetical protein
LLAHVAGLSEIRRRTTCGDELDDDLDGGERRDHETEAGGVKGSDLHLQRVPWLPAQVQRAWNPGRRQRSGEQRLPLQVFLPYLGDGHEDLGVLWFSLVSSFQWWKWSAFCARFACMVGCQLILE